MFSQEEIDAVLRDAQQAVNTLASETRALAGGTSPAAPSPSARRTPPPISPAPSGPAARPAASDIGRILRVRVPVVVRLAERVLPCSEVMELGPGSIIEFERRVDSDLDLLVNNRQIGSGQAVKVGERFGLRVHRIGDVADRVRSMSSS